jgi:hypothetical protein
LPDRLHASYKEIGATSLSFRLLVCSSPSLEGETMKTEIRISASILLMKAIDWNLTADHGKYYTMAY